ncbi:hypothetical protein D6779_04695 [Candidatus Parcubacteria bacterium]|nr:MAG: hypothetical protein D6779_04695 [Candidatus Parcubacteria bacterium]
MTIAAYSLKKILFQGKGSALICRTAMGEITVLDQHRPLIAPLVQGVAKIIDMEGKEHFIPVRSGFLEVRPGSEVRMIIEEDIPE